MRRAQKLWISILIMAVALLGCKPEDEYGKGYRKGKEVGHAEGYEECIEKEAFKLAYPGAEPRLQGFWGFSYKVLVVAGALKLLAALLYTIVLLTYKSSGHREAIGKVLMAALGSSVVLWMAQVFRFWEALRDFLLSPASISALNWLLVGLTSAVVAYFIAAMFKWIFIDSRVGVWAESWCILISAASLTALIPIAFDIAISSTEFDRYLLSDILPGSLMGGVFFVSKILLNESIKEDGGPARPNPT